jgi:hypothetical protein
MRDPELLEAFGFGATLLIQPVFRPRSSLMAWFVCSFLIC